MKEQERNNLKRLLWLGNVHGFFPDRPVKDLHNGYQKWLDHKQQFQELYTKTKLTIVKQDPCSPLFSEIHAGVMLTFHYGPYRLLPRYLLAMGNKVTLLVSTDVLEREAAQYKNELDEMGLPMDSFACLDAHDPMVLRKICQAVDNKRVVLVFLDANESLATNSEKDQEGKLRIAFGAHYFYWRINMLKIAQRFGIPVSVTHMELKRNGDQQLWQMREPLLVLTADDKNKQEALLRAFAVLQQSFQEMIRKDWTAWENWSLLHWYTHDKEKGISTTLAATGSWLIPFSFGDKAYLFDLSSKGFYEVLVKK